MDYTARQLNINLQVLFVVKANSMGSQETGRENKVEASEDDYLVPKVYVTAACNDTVIGNVQQPDDVNKMVVDSTLSEQISSQSAWPPYHAAA